MTSSSSIIATTSNEYKILFVANYNPLVIHLYIQGIVIYIRRTKHVSIVCSGPCRAAGTCGDCLGSSRVRDTCNPI